MSTICPICAGTCSLLDVVDFNKSCEVPGGKIMPPCGIPISYFLCERCGFCLAPEIAKWPQEDFESKIYNSEYVHVDPGYVDARPRANASMLVKLFGERKTEFRHLDYGGGSGLLSELLRESGWNSTSYDPFVDRGVNPGDLGKFDLVSAFEVFEHVPDVTQLMSNLSSLLAENGVVIFSTLLSDGNIAPQQRLGWWYASPRNGHISLFSRKSLATLIVKNGYRLGSFSSGFHLFWKNIPSWAGHIIRTPTPTQE
jgi:SAM-dependent methyltransferase